MTDTQSARKQLIAQAAKLAAQMTFRYDRELSAQYSTLAQEYLSDDVYCWCGERPSFQVQDEGVWVWRCDPHKNRGPI